MRACSISAAVRGSTASRSLLTLPKWSAAISRRRWSKRRATALPQKAARILEFICGNFADLTFDEPFDVVFAHFTPAINSATEFQKMVSLARSWCFMACPTRRRDFVLEEARRLASVEHGDPDRDRNFLYGFAYAWLLGKTPTVMHYDDVWLDQRTLEDAQTVYANHLVAPDLSQNRKRSFKTISRRSPKKEQSTNASRPRSPC